MIVNVLVQPVADVATEREVKDGEGDVHRVLQRPERDTRDQLVEAVELATGGGGHRCLEHDHHEEHWNALGEQIIGWRVGLIECELGRPCEVKHVACRRNQPAQRSSRGRRALACQRLAQENNQSEERKGLPAVTSRRRGGDGWW